mgnify:CR=1 FL=1
MDRTILEQLDAAAAAKRLLGCELVRTFGSNETRVKIVETEAYHQSDAASHSYSGRTQRTEVMFGPAGFLYVYFTYGMHYCCNVVIGPEGEGSAILIRAVEPIEGEELLHKNRSKFGVDLTNGPAKLCQALDIDKAMNGHDLANAPIQLLLHEELPAGATVQTTRIGISKAIDVPWRFYIKDNPYVSKT